VQDERARRTRSSDVDDEWIVVEKEEYAIESQITRKQQCKKKKIDLPRRLYEAIAGWVNS
jgi:hypothetical protein